MKSCKTVDAYIQGHPEWSDALQKLRRILKATDLEETIKWGAPCYTLADKNVIGLVSVADYTGLWFHQGVFLADPKDVLINAQEGTTKALRQWRFTHAKDIKSSEIKPYILEAIENQKQGKSVKPVRTKTLAIPTELAAILSKSSKTKKAFDALTAGRQREYADHIASAKREATRQSRAAKARPLIESGVGLNDKYRK